MGESQIHGKCEGYFINNLIVLIIFGNLSWIMELVRFGWFFTKDI